MPSDDPYCDQKTYHYAAQIRGDGAVSALCYKTPRAIAMARGHSWTLQKEAVTCPKCRRLLRRPPG